MSKTSVALDNLRAFVILIVLAFHSLLAYLQFLPASPHPFDAPPYKWRAFAIIDSTRFIGFDLFCAYQDVYLMSLMFFLSGLFVWPSLVRKGSLTFLTDRLIRLGLPFAFALLLLMPVTLYPTYRATATDPSVGEYWRQFMALPFWPSGPQWFLWQLLTLNIVAVALYRFSPTAIQAIGALAAALGRHPVKFFLVLAGASAVAYVPLALAFTPWEWLQVGPFGVQQSRPLHYAVYFFTGVAIGTAGLKRGLLAADGALALRWRSWLIASLACFSLWIALTAQTMNDGEAVSLGLRLAADVSLPLACAAACFSSFSLFLRFATVRFRAAESLSDNAYGMYLVHYVFVVWLQYALLDVPLGAVAKATIVFAITLVLSWGSAAAIRCIPLGLDWWANGAPSRKRHSVRGRPLHVRTLKRPGGAEL
jgi:peptidoglycan/LPS O-acetylase OafA/YrhL